jgi:hypothetical protein
MKYLFYFFLPILACASGSSAPDYYGLSIPDYSKGQLLGTKEKHDLPISTCQPDQFQKGKCVVVLREDFERLRTDYEIMQIRLRHYEKNCKN